jgi:DNA ligase (NAD+)
MKTRKEHEDLLTKYNNAYRKGESLISDAEYNKLESEYQKQYSDIEGQQFLQSLRDTPTDKKRKETLPVKMTSLDKCKSVEEIQKWVIDKTEITKSVDLIITPKYDGISLLVDEENGHCWTKGIVAEQEGQKSDEHFSAMHLSTVPRLKMTIGEAIMRRSTFNTKYSKKVGGKYSHPRNMIAGLFNANEPDPALADVEYITYGYPRGYCMEIDKREQVTNLYVPYIMFDSHGLTEIFLSDTFYNWKAELGYDIDGLVIDINDADLRQDCTDMSSGNVGYAVAYKDPSWSQRVTTKVETIELKVSKQGKVKPVAILEPVDIDGVEISRVTVSNMKTATDLKLYPGCEIEIKRSGDVIPKITKVHGYSVPQRDEIPNDKEFKEAWQKMIDYLEPLNNLDCVTEFHKEIKFCLTCGNELKWDETHTELLCDNNQCPSRLLAKAVYFFETLGIENFGEPSIAQIQHDLDRIHPFDIMGISAGELMSLDGWGETSVGTLLTQFDNLEVVGVPLARLLTALDLFDGKIAEKTCQLILDNTDLETLGILSIEDSIKELVKIKGISDITAKAFYEGYCDYCNNFSCEHQIKISYIQTPRAELKSDTFLGQQICFTGFRNKDWEKIIAENGGKIVDGVSKNTTLLVQKDLSSMTSKKVQAEKLGIIVLSEIDFKLRLTQLGLL